MRPPGYERSASGRGRTGALRSHAARRRPPLRATAISKDDHAVALGLLGVPPEEQHRLAAYLDLVAVWNQRTNLTGARTPSERVDVLVADAWVARGFVRPGTLLDVGSGNGSPGLVLALLRSDLKVTLMEPRARRWAFLREAVRELGRSDVTVVRSRSETYRGPRAQTLTLRAVGGELGTLRELVEPGGEVLVFGGRPNAPPWLVETARHPLKHAELHVFQATGLGVSRET